MRASRTTARGHRHETRDPSQLTVVVDGRRLEQKRKAAVRSRRAADKHGYFEGIAQARYVLRKVYRIVEEQAKTKGLDPLAHQTLIQIYGSPAMALRVNHIAERLDISPAFASNLVRMLVEKSLVTRMRDASDRRVTPVAITKSGIALLHEIDGLVKFHVDYFTRQLTPHQRESALSILMFYVGISIAVPNAARG